MGFNKGLIIGILLITMCFSVFMGLALDLTAKYDIAVDGSYNDSFDEYARAYELTKDLENTIQGGDVNVEGQDQAVYKNVVVAGKISRQSAEIAQTMVTAVPTVIGIPVTTTNIILSIIFLLSTFGFIAMISRRNP